MFKKRYFVSLAAVAIGASFQFYSFGVVNAPQRILEKWINDIYTNRTNASLSSSTITLIWSATTSSIAVGACVGCLFVKWMAERFGRRDSIIINGVVNIVAGGMEFGSKYASSPEMLIAGRFLIGVCMGITSGLAPMYLMEITPTAYRGAAGTVHQIAVSFSDWFSLFVGLSFIMGNEALWPVAFSLPALNALFMVIVLPFMPRSPKYLLLSKQDRPGCIKSIEQMIEKDSQKLVYEQVLCEARSVLSKAYDNHAFWTIFRRQRLREPMLICLLVMIAQQFTGCAAVFAYSTNIFINANVSESTAQLATLAIGVAYFIFVLPSTFLIEKKGRRFLSLFQLIGCTICLVFLSISIALYQFFSFEYATYCSIASLILYMCIYGLGSPIPWLISSELFGQEYRSAAVTLSTFTAWLLCFFISIGYLPFQNLVTPAFSFLPFIIIETMCIILIAIVLPETKNRSIEEIIDDFKQRSRSLTIAFSYSQFNPQVDKTTIDEIATLLEKSSQVDAENEHLKKTRGDKQNYIAVPQSNKTAYGSMQKTSPLVSSTESGLRMPNK